MTTIVIENEYDFRTRDVGKVCVCFCSFAYEIHAIELEMLYVRLNISFFVHTNQLNFFNTLMNLDKFHRTML